MIDIHAHVIPFIDDGSKSLEDSIQMIRDSLDNGVNTIVCTPHHRYGQYTPSLDFIEKNFNLLKTEIQDQNIPIKLYLGQEIYMSSRENALKMLQSHELLTINNSKYVLLEFNYDEKYPEVSELIYNYIVSGYIPIIAHVERYKWMDIETIKKMKEYGALIQVNSGTIVGENGLKAKLLSKKLIRLGLVGMVASDVHSFRKTSMKEANNKVKREDLFNFDLFL
jgi:protein-tyrosine phosphatase